MPIKYYGQVDMDKIQLTNKITGEVKNLVLNKDRNIFEEEIVVKKKTVLVKYVSQGTDKKYAFNVKGAANLIDAVKVGTVFSVKSYANDFVVVSILDDTFEYVNRENGDLKKSVSNTNDFRLKEIDLDKLEKVISFVEV